MYNRWLKRHLTYLTCWPMTAVKNEASVDCTCKKNAVAKCRVARIVLMSTKNELKLRDTVLFSLWQKHLIGPDLRNICVIRL